MDIENFVEGFNKLLTHPEWCETVSVKISTWRGVTIEDIEVGLKCLACTQAPYSYVSRTVLPKPDYAPITTYERIVSDALKLLAEDVSTHMNSHHQDVCF